MPIQNHFDQLSCCVFFQSYPIVATRQFIPVWAPGRIISALSMDYSTCIRQDADISCTPMELVQFTFLMKTVTVMINVKRLDLLGFYLREIMSILRYYTFLIRLTYSSAK